MRITIVGDWNPGAMLRATTHLGTELRRAARTFNPAQGDRSYQASWIGFDGTIILHGDAPLAKPKENAGEATAPVGPAADGGGDSDSRPAASKGKTKVLRKG